MEIFTSSETMVKFVSKIINFYLGKKGQLHRCVSDWHVTLWIDSHLELCSHSLLLILRAPAYICLCT